MGKLKKMKPEKIRATYYIQKQTQKMVKKIAGTEKRSISHYINVFLTEGVARYFKKKKKR